MYYPLPNRAKSIYMTQGYFFSLITFLDSALNPMFLYQYNRLDIL